MPILWRISNHLDLDGNGGKFFASRWSTLGHPVVYLAESPAGALLEILVHLEYPHRKMPPNYMLIGVDVPEELAVESLSVEGMTDWKRNLDETRKRGDSWLTGLSTPLARVPSAIVAHTWNIVLNPVHEAAKQARIESVSQERFDTRLFRFGV
jgi:RES domain-containing protein